MSEELDKQYHEDKARAKDASENITVACTWMFENFKSAIEESISEVSDINQLVFEDFLEKAREKGNEGLRKEEMDRKNMDVTHDHGHKEEKKHEKDKEKTIGSVIPCSLRCEF